MGLALILATIVMAVLTFGGFVAIPLWLVFLPLGIVLASTLASLALMAWLAFVTWKEG